MFSRIGRAISLFIKADSDAVVIGYTGLGAATGLTLAALSTDESDSLVSCMSKGAMGVFICGGLGGFASFTHPLIPIGMAAGMPIWAYNRYKYGWKSNPTVNAVPSAVEPPAAQVPKMA